MAMTNNCATCPALRAQIGELEQKVSKLELKNRKLRDQIKLLNGYIQYLLGIINRTRKYCEQVAQAASKKREKGGLAPSQYHRLLGVLQMARKVKRKLRVN